MKYAHLFFDLDHTIWDFETNSMLALKAMYGEFGLAERLQVPFTEFHAVYRKHNHHLWDLYSKGMIKQDELRWKRMWNTLLDHKIADETLSRSISKRYLEALPQQKALFEYTHEILTYLKQKGYTLHIISNGFEEVQHRKLAHSGLTDYFNKIITSEGSGFVKPQPEIFHFAVEQAGTTLNQSLMIGDNPEADIQGALDAGMDAVFVDHIGASVSIQPTYTIHHLKELEAIL